MLLNLLLTFFIVPIFNQGHLNFNGFVQLATNQPVVEQKVPERIYGDVLDIIISAQSAIALDVKSGKVLYQKNSQEIRPIASITKLMTALVFLEHNPGWNTEIYTIAADRKNGGIIYLNTGEVLTLDNLFKMVLVVSDNDSAMALARSTGLSQTQFIAEMNKKAQQLGLNNTHFADPTGLYLNNKSTTEDVAKLLNVALANETIAKTTSIVFYEFEVKGTEKNRTVKLKNTDWLLKSYLNVVGGKTGSLEEAGYCLAVKIIGETNQEIIVVVLGSQSNYERFQDVKAISDWVLLNYLW